ncbi:MAG: iron ABC transporter permease [Ruthenibacterium sp.]
MSAVARKNRTFLWAAFILMGVAFGASLLIGRYPLSPALLFAGDEQELRIFFTLRVPRTVMALVAGFGLSVAGGVYQLIFKNALASPDIIGVSSGASAGAAVAILFLGGGVLATAVCAFFGGLAAVLLALLLAGAANQRHLATFVLSGIAVNALAQAVLMGLKLTADPERQLASIEFWTMGSLAGMTASKLPAVLCITVGGMLGLFLLYRQIVLLSLDADEAKMLGVRVDSLRRLVLVLATLVVGGIVSVTGLISFVGLLAPHIARLVMKNNRVQTLLFSGAVGGSLLLIADCVARSIATAEIPVSILTSLIGAPFLIYLICKGEKVA